MVPINAPLTQTRAPGGIDRKRSLLAFLPELFSSACRLVISGERSGDAVRCGDLFGSFVGPAVGGADCGVGADCGKPGGFAPTAAELDTDVAPAYSVVACALAKA